MCCLFGGVGTVCHGNAAVGVFQSEDIIDAIAYHADNVTGGLVSLDDSLFLFGGNAPEHAIVGREFS